MPPRNRAIQPAATWPLVPRIRTTARSFWLEEALSMEVNEVARPLLGATKADVCIVGGGFAGMWTAYELKQRNPQLAVVILEKDICGGGASGRNGGHFSPSWTELDSLCRLYGEQEGKRYAFHLSEQISEVEHWGQKHSCDIAFRRAGAVSMALGPWQEAAVEQMVATAARRGVEDRVVPLDRDSIKQYVATETVSGGAFIPDQATIQPARLARSLRKVLLELGVRIFESTEVVDFEGTCGRRTVRARTGSVAADQVIVTAGAWSGRFPAFGRAFGVLGEHMVVTEPIGDRLEEVGWRSDVALLDSREMLYYLRKTEDGRVAIGGGAASAVFGSRLDSPAVRDQRCVRSAAEGLSKIFPALKDVRFTHAWSGPVDMSVSLTPVFATVEPGYHVACGFSGHGLAATKLGGKILASLTMGEEDEWSSLPVVSKLPTVPPEPIRFLLARIGIAAIVRSDRRQEAGGRPSRLALLTSKVLASRGGSLSDD